MSKFVDLTNQRFGRLITVEKTDLRSSRGHVIWKCKCDCGKETFVSSNHLISGNTTSCGCLQKERASKAKTTHGQYQSSEYRSWQMMRNRCYNPNYNKFKDYGGRGIEVCDRWKDSFENFLEDMGPKPSSKHSIDRIDVDGNYESWNCKWSTTQEQARNRRNQRDVKLIDSEGQEYLIAGGLIKQFCKDAGLHSSNISAVLNGKLKHYKGWTGYYLN